MKAVLALVNISYRRYGFWSKIRAIEDAKWFDSHQLAERLGYATNSYTSEVEKGASIPSEEKLKKIAKALGVPF